MNSVFQEIEKIREGHSFQLSAALSNRHTIICQESPREKTAYCFSVPIRNNKNNGIVDLRFYHNKQSSVFNGSNSQFIITDRVKMINQYGQCEVLLQGELKKKTNESIIFTNNEGIVEILPTLNGLLFMFCCRALSEPPQILLHFDRSFESTRTNNKFFSVMREKHIPFITASCIGSINDYGKVVAPVEIFYQRLNEFDYVLTFNTSNKSKNCIAIEINMQESKLFQDTTVESKHPTINNAFGGIAFLGKSEAFGEQMLYSRLEISNIALLQNKKILKSILHIPQLGYGTSPIAVNRTPKRFCSFGSNWENKIDITDIVALSTESNGYYHLDLTKLFGNLNKNSQNFVIRGNSTNKPVIIPTGDSFYAPQIFEVKYQ